MNKKGFTLIELLITVAIIGILAAVAIPAYIGQQKSASRTEAFTNLQNLRLLQEQAFADRGRYSPADPAAVPPYSAPLATPLGTAGKDHPGNVAIIQAGGSPADANNALPGFRPGTGLAFSYWIVAGRQITNANILDGTNTGTGALATCYIAFAQGNSAGRNRGETFAIDCNNNKNF